MIALQQPFLFCLALQFLDLRAQPLVFMQLNLQKLYGHARPLLDPAWGKQIGIGQLVVAVAEVIDLQAAFFDQRVDAKINLAKADTQAFCHISLGKAGVVFQCFEQAVACVIVVHGCVQLMNSAHYSSRASPCQGQVSLSFLREATRGTQPQRPTGLEMPAKRYIIRLPNSDSFAISKTPVQNLSNILLIKTSSFHLYACD